MVIVGASFDEPADNQAWAEDEAFVFDLWSDTDRVLALHYGAASSESQAYAARMSFLLDAEGELLLEYLDASPVSNPGDVLSDCEALFGP